MADDDDEEAEYGHTGGYAGIAGTYTFNTSHGVFDDLIFDSGGILAWLGYRIDPFLGLEVQGEWQNGMKDINGFTIVANLNWYPLEFWVPSYFIQPFLLTGAGVISAKVPGRSTDLSGAFRLGGGVDFYVTKHWMVRLKSAWVTGVGRLDDIQYVPIALGVQYNW